MIQWPAPDRLSRVAADNLERLKKAGATQDLEDDARTWVVASWAWLPDAPYAFVFRAEKDERHVVMERDNTWVARAIRPASIA